MPRAPKKCARPECETRITGKAYCDVHTPTNWGKGSRRTSTTEHKAWRNQVLERDKHTCQIKGPRCQRIANEADHIIPDFEGGTTSIDNGQAACTPCHQDKTQGEAARARARRGRSTPSPR